MTWMMALWFLGGYVALAFVVAVVWGYHNRHHFNYESEGFDGVGWEMLKAGLAWPLVMIYALLSLLGWLIGRKARRAQATDAKLRE